MRKVLIIGVLFAAGLITMNAAYAEKSTKKIAYVDTLQKNYTIKQLDVTWTWNGSAWIETDDL